MINTMWDFIKENEIISTLSLIVTFVTLWKVASIKKAQARYDKLVDINNLSNLMKRISDYITGNVKYSPESITLQHEIHNAIGIITGVKTTLQIFDEKEIISKPEATFFIEEGYYSNDFLTKKIKDTKLTLDIFAKRNQRLAVMDNLQSIASMLEKNKNCRVRLMAVSSDTEDAILNEMNKTIPVGCPDVNALKNELSTNRNTIISFKNNLSDDLKSRFFYYEFLGSPPFHIVKVDDFLYYGLVNYHKDPTQYNVVENRPCIELDVKNNDFARRIISQFDKFVEECENSGRAF